MAGETEGGFENGPTARIKRIRTEAFALMSAQHRQDFRGALLLLVCIRTKSSAQLALPDNCRFLYLPHTLFLAKHKLWCFLFLHYLAFRVHKSAR